MELSFVIAALRRNGWVIVVCSVLGFFASLSIEPPRAQFESNGLLLLSPSGFDGGVAYANQPDRFVLTQLGVLQAEGLADRVAERVNAGSSLEETAGSVSRNTEMTQNLDSDTVNIATTTGQALRSQLIAQAYLDLYIEEARATVEGTSQPELDRLGTEIDRVETELASVQQQIVAVMAPFLPSTSDEITKQIPAPGIVAPELTTRLDNLTAQLKALNLSRIALESEVFSSFNSIIVQDATLPVSAIGNSTALLTAALVFVATTLGFIIALVWTRFSDRVLDDLQASEILGMPIVGELDHSRSLRRSPLVACDNLPSSLIPVIDQLSVRAEALGSVTEPLTVAVVGTQRVAGTTTLATAMAGRFSAAEFEVVLVDLDASDPYLSEAFGGIRGEGLAAVFTPNPERAFIRTGRTGVTLLGRGHRAVSIRRDLVGEVLDVAKSRAHIVIIDAGSVLDAAATVELCDLVDAVVLAVPLRRQETRPLGHVARQFEPITKKVLPIITHPMAKRAALSSDNSHAAPETIEEALVPATPPTPRQALPTEPAEPPAQPVEAPTSGKTAPRSESSKSESSKPGSGKSQSSKSVPAGSETTTSGSRKPKNDRTRSDRTKSDRTKNGRKRSEQSSSGSSSSATSSSESDQSGSGSRSRS